MSSKDLNPTCVCVAELKYFQAGVELAMQNPIGVWLEQRNIMPGQAPFARVLRSRMKREEKAKVVAAVCGEEFIQFLAALAIFPGKFF